jgi:hypothetical protein
MSGDLIPYLPGGGLDRDARRAGRQISRVRAHAVVRQTAIDAETDVAIAKVDAVTAASGHSLGAVVRVAQARRQLELIAPEAAGDLAFIAARHAMVVGDVLEDLARELRRR